MLAALCKNLIAFAIGLLAAAGLIAANEKLFAYLNTHASLNRSFASVNYGSAQPEKVSTPFEIPTTFSLSPQLRAHRGPHPPYLHPPVYTTADGHTWCCTKKYNTVLPNPGRYETRDNVEGPVQAFYTIDEHGHRITPQSSANPRSFAVFLGCSVTYGQGLSDNETLPYDFEKFSGGRVRAYNYAFGAYGPNDLLMRARGEDAALPIPEKRGLFIYTFIDNHVRRMMGSIRTMGAMTPYHPHLRFENGKVTSDGRFDEVWPIWTRLAPYFLQSELLRYFQVDFPPRIERDAPRLFAIVVDEIRKSYLEAHPDSRFLVLFHPDSMTAPYIIPELARLRIPYLDYSRIPYENFMTEEPTLPDGHPSAATNRLIARQLLKDVLVGP